MQAEDLYKKILGIELPWLISNIEIDEKTHHVTVELGHARFAKFPCSKCGNLCSVHAHQSMKCIAT